MEQTHPINFFTLPLEGLGRIKCKKIYIWETLKLKDMPGLSLLTPPLARTIAITAAASITHDNGFHMKLRNFNILFS